MKRILISGLSTGYGGIESIIINIIKYIDKSKYQFDFIFSSNKKCKFINDIEIHGGQIFNVTPWGKNPQMYKRDLQSIFKLNKNYDFVWINTSSASIITLQKIAKKYTNAKIIVHSHGTSLESVGFIKKTLLLILHKLNYKKFIQLTDLQFACSVEAANWLFGNQYEKETHIINNAIESKEYIFNYNIRDVYRKELGLLDKFVLIHVGRITKVKNHSFLIEIFREINKRNPDSRLIIVGDGDMEKDTRTRVKYSNLEDKVLFMGPRDDISNLLMAADLFVLPSFSEGLPLVTIEAQASGLKSIVSSVVPIEAKITNLVEFCSLDQSAEYWAKVILSSVDYERLDMSKEIVKAGFDITSTVLKIEDLLNVERRLGNG